MTATTTTEESAGVTTGGVRTLLRIEGLTLFIGMTMLYGVWGGSWWIYAVLFLVPDLSFIAYLAGPRTGAPTGALARRFLRCHARLRNEVGWTSYVIPSKNRAQMLGPQDQCWLPR